MGRERQGTMPGSKEHHELVYLYRKPWIARFLNLSDPCRGTGRPMWIGRLILPPQCHRQRFSWDQLLRPGHHRPAGLTTPIAPGGLLGPSACGSSVAGMIRRFGRSPLHFLTSLPAPRDKELGALGYNGNERILVEKSGPWASQGNMDEPSNATIFASRVVGTPCVHGMFVPRATSRLRLPAFKRLELSVKAAAQHDPLWGSILGPGLGEG